LRLLARSVWATNGARAGDARERVWLCLAITILILRLRFGEAGV
jgi:hypothetical protein